MPANGTARYFRQTALSFFAGKPRSYRAFVNFMSTTSKLARILFGLLAYISLGIGLIAIVVPGLPTTEFILLAAWAATKSSPRLSAWLENHRLFGRS